MSDWQAILDRGADPNTRLGARTALGWAAGSGQLTGVRGLLQAGADPDFPEADEPHPRLRQLFRALGPEALEGEPLGRTPLGWAVEQGHLEVAEELLAAGASPVAEDFLGFAPLDLAAQAGHLALVERLLQAGAPINRAGPAKVPPLLAALLAGHGECARLLLKSGAAVRVAAQSTSPLLEAAGLADADLLRRILAAGAPLASPKKASPVLARLCAATQQVPLAQAPPGNFIKIHNARGSWATIPRDEGQILECLELLLAAGADLHAPSYLGPPLMAAARQGLLQVAQRLLQAGADPNCGYLGGATRLPLGPPSCSLNQDTPLSIAQLFGQTALVELLEPLSQPQPPKSPQPQAVITIRRLDPPDFSPLAQSGEFLAAVAELETLLGQPAQRPAHLKGGVQWHLTGPPPSGWDTLTQQRRRREQGLYLFECDYSPQRPQSLALIPFPRWQDALALLQTHGSNYNLGPWEIIRWLERLQLRQPFELHTISRDTLAGNFLGPIPNPKALARSMAKFCPDIVDQGCLTLAALAEELAQQDAKLFLWWD